MKGSSHGTAGATLAPPPYPETIPGALTFLMAEFKKFIAERLALENERAVAQEAMAQLATQNAALQLRETQLQRDIQLLEYALDQERLQRPYAASAPKAAVCDVGIQVFLPGLSNPPAPPRPKSPSPSPRDVAELQRTPSLPVDSSSRPDAGKSPRHVSNCASGKKKRPFPVPGLEEGPAAVRAGCEPDLPTQVTQLPQPQSAPHRPFPKPKGKASPGGLVRPQSVRHPSPPPEHPVAKAPLRYPLDLAVDEANLGRGPSPSRATDAFLLMSPEPRMAAWSFSSAVTPNANHRNPLPDVVLHTPPADIPSSTDESVSSCDASSSSSSQRDPGSPFSLQMDDDASPVRLEYGEESPKFNMALPLGSVLHMTRREEPAAEFDLLADPAGMFAPALQGTLQSNAGGKLWRANLSLHSHFDTARCLAWHPLNAYLLSGSDDHTLRLWNLNPWGKTKGVTPTRMDLTPMAIYRGHTGPVTECVLLNDSVVSASCDTTLKVWHLSLRDTQQHNVDLCGHTDAVWSVDAHPSEPWALSSAADGRVCLWDWSLPSPLLRTFTLGSGEVPTCARFDPAHPSSAVVAFRSCVLVCVDLETQTIVCQLDGTQLSGAVEVSDPVPAQINKVAMHPSMPLFFTAHENGMVKLWDLSAGKLVDCVTCHDGHIADVSIHSNAKMMATAGHGRGSLRIWDLNKRALLEDVTLHSGKRSETVVCVRWHSSKPLLATGGADSTVQVLALR